MHSSRVTVDHVGWRCKPQSLVSEQLSLPYYIASLLPGDEAFVDQFTGAAVGALNRIRLSRLMNWKEDPAITACGKAFRHLIHVEMALRNSARMERTVEALHGSEHNLDSIKPW